MYLLFGASGRAGQVIARAITDSGVPLLAPTHAECPLENAAAVSDLVLASGAEVVVNCAAISGLEACGDDPLQAHLVNAVAPAAMALACRHTGAKFIHLSTDYVLDGRRAGLKDESAKCRPICVYGESKREGELQVLEANPKSIVARVSWIGGNPYKPGFVETMLHKALAGEPLSAIDDKYSKPTDAEDIARVVIALASSDAAGVVHLCSAGKPISWRACAQIALDEAIRMGALSVAPAVERQLLDSVTFFREPRPRHTAMHPMRLETWGISMPTAEQTLRHIAQRFLQQLLQ